MIADHQIQDQLLELARAHFRSDNLRLKLLKGDGSDRQIHLIPSPDDSRDPVVGVYHEDLAENRSFIFITGKMKAVSLPVPEIISIAPSEKAYLLQYLGEHHLGQTIEIWRSQGEHQYVVSAYQRVMDVLLEMQNNLTPHLTEYLKNRLMTRSDFEGDLAYFERDFVNRFKMNDLYTGAVRRELRSNLIDRIVELPADVFVYRDFQSRNIMWYRNQPWFLDYQSAFLGTRYYDLASLLFASKAGLEAEERTLLMKYYYDIATPDISYEEYLKNFYRFVLIRRIRSLGSYGFLSMVKKKQDFFKAIKPGIRVLNELLTKEEALEELSHTRAMIGAVAERWEKTIQQPC